MPAASICTCSKTLRVYSLCFSSYHFDEQIEEALPGWIVCSLSKVRVHVLNARKQLCLKPLLIYHTVLCIYPLLFYLCVSILSLKLFHCISPWWKSRAHGMYIPSPLCDSDLLSCDCTSCLCRHKVTEIHKNTFPAVNNNKCDVVYKAEVYKGNCTCRQTEQRGSTVAHLMVQCTSSLLYFPQITNTTKTNVLIFNLLIYSL